MKLKRRKDGAVISDHRLLACWRVPVRTKPPRHGGDRIAHGFKSTSWTIDHVLSRMFGSSHEQSEFRIPPRPAASTAPPKSCNHHCKKLP